MTEAIFRTASGKYMDLLNPIAEDIDVHDIATGLSNLCRYNGQVKEFYSVAQHSVLCWWLAKLRGCTPQERLACLLHDAAEAYIGDMVRPLKRHFDAFRFVEQRIDIAIAEALQFDHREHASLVKIVDLEALKTEKTNIFPDDLVDWDDIKNVDPVIVPKWSYWAPPLARESFLSHLSEAVKAVEREANNELKAGV